MNTTFDAKNDQRNQLFFLMNHYMDSIMERFECPQNGLEIFSEIYEGVAIIKDIGKNQIKLELNDGRTVSGFKVTTEISALLRPKDQMYLVMGKYGGYWWPIDLVSVASAIELKDSKGMSQVHFSLNPLVMAPEMSKETMARSHQKEKGRSL